MFVDFFVSAFFSPASEGQVLELCVLQVHLYFRRDECSDDGGSGALGGMVHLSGIPASPGSALQRPL